MEIRERTDVDRDSARPNTIGKMRVMVVATRRRWLERQEEKVAVQGNWQNEWYDIKQQGTMAKAPPCPERTLKTPLPQ